MSHNLVVGSRRGPGEVIPPGGSRWADTLAFNSCAIIQNLSNKITATRGLSALPPAHRLPPGGTDYTGART